jgi:peptide/nickel transport system substrate-binding protein
VRRVLILLAGLLALPGCRYVSGSDARREPPAAAESTANTGDAWIDGTVPPEAARGTPKRGGQVVVQMNVEPPSLNSIVDSDFWGGEIAEEIYDTLVDLDPYDDPDYRIVPELAERWEISDDKLVYTFHLRHGVVWHDGEPFTARDVVATYAKVMHDQVKAAHLRAYMTTLARYEALDDYTVRFTWTKPYFFAMDVPFASIPIQPAHVLEKLSPTQYNEAATNPLNRHPIGTSAFAFVQWETNQKVVLERNERFWGKPPHLDRLVFRIVKEDRVALELAQRGEIDVVDKVPPEQWVRMPKQRPELRDRFYRSRFFEANYQWIGWNEQRPMFQDRRVRRALALLVDRPGFIQHVLHGLYLATTCHFYWKSRDCDPSLSPLPYDPREAVRLLEEVGWRDTDGDGIRDRNGIPFRFTFMVPATADVTVQLATMMKEQYHRAGIDLSVQLVEWSSFTRRLREREFDVCSLLWMGGPRGDPIQIWHSRSANGGSNYIGFSNARADALMDRATVVFDDAERSRMYREFGKILYDEQPYAWLFTRPRLSLLSRRIHGIRESLLFWQYRDWWVE